MEEISQKEGAAVRLPYDVIVVGAGAAGMMAAGTAARNGHRVLLLEKMEKSGRKVRITGKGRCNVTNARPPEEFAGQVRTNAEFFSTAFAEFNNRATIRFFERLGVKLDVERGERVFPRSGKAWDIANALLEYCVDNGVKIVYDTRVTEIMTLNGRVFGVRYRKAGIRAQGGVSARYRRHGRRFLSRYGFDRRRLRLCGRYGACGRTGAAVAYAAGVVLSLDQKYERTVAPECPCDALHRR